MQEIRPVNRPPAFDLGTVDPIEPVVYINTACRDERTEFRAQVIDLDVEQHLTARWFWNYDYRAADEESVRPIFERPITRTGEPQRELPFWSLPRDGQDADGPHTLEVFVVETNALVQETVAPPFYRNLRNCEEEGYPEDCVSTHPAVMRWTVFNYFNDTECRPDEP